MRSRPPTISTCSSKGDGVDGKKDGGKRPRAETLRREHWKDDPEEHDFPAAANYLTLVATVARQTGSSLRCVPLQPPSSSSLRCVRLLVIGRFRARGGVLSGRC
jgi:hypothetical protein